MKLYHGSIHSDIKEFRKGTYLSEYRGDAICFAVPWESWQIDWRLTPAQKFGRPPKKLAFINNPPEDCQIFLYTFEVYSDEVELSRTNTGAICAGTFKSLRKFTPISCENLGSWQELLLVTGNSTRIPGFPRDQEWLP